VDSCSTAAAGSSANGAPKRPPGAPVVEQWASRVIAFSSQFSASDNGAIQLLGAPKHFPSSGSAIGCWSALPQPGRSIEWVRLGLTRQVTLWPDSFDLYETYHPGSVYCIRVAPDARVPPEQWLVAWSRDEDEVQAAASGTLPSSRIFTPSLHAAVLGTACGAFEIQMDTTGWNEEYWSEVDAVRTIGSPLPGSSAAEAGAVRQDFAVTDSPVSRQAWETDRSFAARARFASSLLPPGRSPATMASKGSVEGMRLAALSMVWQNTHELGCVYPAQVAEQIGVRATAASGLSVEGELRAQKAAAGQ